MSPAMQLAVPARAENVALVRHAVAGVGEAIGMDEEALANLKTVVSEACNNAVVHAYDEGESGTLEVSAARHEDVLEIVVRDHGHGFRPRLTSGHADASLRLGLSLIASLSSGFELRAAEGGGTEVRVLVPIAAREDEPDSESPVFGGGNRGHGRG